MNDDLKTFLLSQPIIAAMVENRVFDTVAEATDGNDHPKTPYLWFSLRGLEQDDCLGGEDLGPEAYLYDIEVHTDDPEELKILVGEIRLLHRYGVDGQREFGASLVHSINIADQIDDYEFRGGFQDAAISAAFDVEVAPYYG